MNIAVVEDNKNDLSNLLNLLNKYKNDYKENYNITTFSDGSEFLNKFAHQFDLIFLDIDMPNSNGMDVAKRIRSTDQASIIIFTTNLANYALQSYEVHAFDYIIKPINYEAFIAKFIRALNAIKTNTSTRFSFKSNGVMQSISTSDIYYFMISGHEINLSSANGDYTIWNLSLSMIEKQLNNLSFYRCSNDCIINLKYVTALQGNLAIINNTAKIVISRNKKQELINKLSKVIE